MNIIERIKRIRPDKVYVFKSFTGDWYWHRKNGWNGKIVADGSQGYAHKSTAVEAARKANSPSVKLYVQGVLQ